ncbi:Na(+)/H(+) antiporter subunit D [Dongia deserti]|uniref:Na(+)/H(+) antiporter subunit D n=1 Tax=Dongia deserti TaxID=2268030 RepID=UPI000E65DF03|nr:Na(+)/H(+) antiporter subunit D [Dongia deserti]
MIGEFSPGLILILGALLVPLLRGRLRAIYMLALPVAAFAHLTTLPHGDLGIIELSGVSLTTLRVDKLSLLFSYVFLVAALICVIYSLHLRDTVQHVAALIYAGSAMGAIFAGDLVTLFIYWEAIAIASVFLIWASRTEDSYRSGMRYLIIQVGSGVLLLAGVLIHYRQTGSLAFGALGLDTPGGLLIFLAFGIKSAFPVLHAWLPDAYPRGTPTGTVFLSAFTTKVAIYALARSFAGTDILIPIGTVMAAFPIFYAVIENDLRRVLAYSLNNQLGFMVVGIGLGTDLALNGAVAHAFADILFKGLLFMSMGAVLFRVGTIKGSELGGLYKSMPWTTGFCIVGAASISAFPLFSGFVTKSMIMTAAMEEGYFWIWIVLLFASAGVFHHAGIKIPYFAFFAHDSGKRCQEAPLNMLVAMAVAAALCIGIGSFPDFFYTLLPFETGYRPYTLDHVVAQVQLLFLSALAFTLLMRTGIYPPELRSVNIDAEWFYRRAGRSLADGARMAAENGWKSVTHGIGRTISVVIAYVQRHHGPEGLLARPWPAGTMALWTTLMLGACLILFYL